MIQAISLATVGCASGAPPSDVPTGAVPSVGPTIVEPTPSDSPTIAPPDATTATTDPIGPGQDGWHPPDDVLSEEVRCSSPQPGACPAAGQAKAIIPFDSCAEDIEQVQGTAPVPAGSAKGNPCCYRVRVRSFGIQCDEGRPMMVAHQALRPAVLGLTGDESPLVTAWLERATSEQASIASFARVALELLALGAPGDLILDAQRAAGDEVHHARVCFAIASHFAGHSLTAGPLALPPQLPLRLDPVVAAMATFEEGAVGETLAALLLSETADAATDPKVATALRRIAEDESRHAALAWRTLAWMIGRFDGVAGAIAHSIAQTREPRTTGHATDELAAHGVLGAAAQRDILTTGWSEVVLPATEALLEGRTAKLQSPVRV
jgi:hypothetical protein